MSTHMPRIVAFWSTMLFHTGRYSGNAFRPHLQMPGLSGYEVLEELRADPTLAPTPVIAVTAFSMQDDQIKVLSAGFNGYLSKPIEPERFVAQVEEYLPLDQRRGGGVA